MLPANPSNKQKLMDWMNLLIHLKGCMIIVFSTTEARRAINQANKLGQQGRKNSILFNSMGLSL